MKYALYTKICNSLVHEIESFPTTFTETINTRTEEILQKLSDAYPCTKAEQIQGILHRLTSNTSRRRIWKFQSRSIKPVDLYLKWADVNAEGRDIVDMAKELDDVPCCYLARLVVKGWLEWQKRTNFSLDIDEYFEVGDEAGQTHPNEDAQTCNSTTDQSGGSNGKSTIYSAIQSYRDPDLIGHKALSEQIKHCHQIDKISSPLMDKKRSDIGIEYEEKMARYIQALRIPYMDEVQMRRNGYSKTPDSILNEPIAIDGHVVKWIESKAWFGDPPSHAAYLKDQYQPYFNRFGPGLVIYWFGFVEEGAMVSDHPGILVLDAFPDSGRITRIEQKYSHLIDSVVHKK